MLGRRLSIGQAPDHDGDDAASDKDSVASHSESRVGEQYQAVIEACCATADSNEDESLAALTAAAPPVHSSNSGLCGPALDSWGPRETALCLAAFNRVGKDFRAIARFIGRPTSDVIAFYYAHKHEYRGPTAAILHGPVMPPDEVTSKVPRMPKTASPSSAGAGAANATGSSGAQSVAAVLSSAASLPRSVRLPELVASKYGICTFYCSACGEQRKPGDVMRCTRTFPSTSVMWEAASSSPIQLHGNGAAAALPSLATSHRLQSLKRRIDAVGSGAPPAAGNRCPNTICRGCFRACAYKYYHRGWLSVSLLGHSLSHEDKNIKGMVQAGGGLGPGIISENGTQTEVPQLMSVDTAAAFWRRLVKSPFFLCLRCCPPEPTVTLSELRVATKAAAADGDMFQPNGADGCRQRMLLSSAREGIAPAGPS